MEIVGNVGKTNSFHDSHGQIMENVGFTNIFNSFHRDLQSPDKATQPEAGAEGSHKDDSPDAKKPKSPIPLN